MTEKRVQFSNIVQNQLPAYVRTDFPLISDFLKQYYIAQEFQSGPIDLIQNIDQYVKLDETTNLVESVILETSIDNEATTINIDLKKSPNGTEGFPDTYGLVKIGDEVITYTGKTNNSFTGCVRGFCGTTDYTGQLDPDQLLFSTSSSAFHTAGDTITNLSSLFLKEFLLKTKYQLLPGFEGRELSPDLNQNVFIKQAKDFYLSKGTDRSFEILFKALYRENVSVVKPKEYLFTPSNADYRIVKNLVVESVSGDPLELEQATLYQDAYPSGIEKAYGPVTSVEKMHIGVGQTFYKISLDAGYNRDARVEGALYGEFSVHSKTKIIGKVTTGTSSIDVDSTVSFPSSGELYVTYDDEAIGVVSYTSKSLNQFYGCTNIIGTINDGTTVGINTYAYGAAFSDQTQTIKVRITSVLEDVDYPSNTTYHTKNETATIKSLGTSDKTFKAKNWFYNVCPTYKIKSFDLIDVSNYTYSVTLDTDHIFKIGDGAVVITSGVEVTESTTTKIVAVTSSKSFNIQGQGVLPPTSTYNIKRLVSRSVSNTFPDSSIYSTNIQNVYKDNTDLLVASPSIPSYNSQPLNASDKSITFKGTYVGDTFNISTLENGTIQDDHGFYTGDAIYYTPELVSTSILNPISGTAGITTSINYLLPREGLYFIKRISSTEVQFAVSRSDIYNRKFVNVSASTTVNNQRIEPYRFRNKSLESQKLLREFSLPESDGNNTPTQPGFTGMLINGVEVLNYKSSDVLRYGKIDDIEVLNPGSNYDIINPTQFKITDAVGTGATGYLGISGSLKEIRIKDSGFDYQREPTITITGGNGTGASARARLTEVSHQVPFNSQVVIGDESGEGGVGTAPTNTIGFGTYHKFHNAEKILYITDSQKAVLGLTTNSSYYVSVQDSKKVKLHNTESDAIAGINTVQLENWGVGRQFIKSYNKKLILDSVVIEDGGYGYATNKTSTLPVGVNTSSNQINIINHNYNSGELIKYTAEGTVIGGLNSGTEYYVTKIDNNNFKLSTINSPSGGVIDKKFNYNTEQYIDFTSVGVGTHVFNYPDINVTLSNEVALEPISGKSFEAEIEPIFRGSIQSVNLSNNGTGYGSSEVLNFEREPLIEIRNATNAQLRPVVNDGKLVEVQVIYQGSGYIASPDIVVDGTGIGAEVIPILTGDRVTSVKIINGGKGYAPNNTTVTVYSPGANAQFRTNIKTWRVNLVEKNKNKVTADDGYIALPLNTNYGLQYSHLYAPRKLREEVFSINQDGDPVYGQYDLKIVAGEEVPSIYHSPIIGWAYDGNPIYGPFGYSSNDGGSIIQLKSGYILELSDDRPSTSVFPAGFFIEDYSYIKKTDSTILDENNGRFCVTPEFPKGTYAYFATINDGSVDSTGPFEGYKSPQFPYLIGNKYNSVVNDFNFQITANQDNIGLNTSNWSRNTEPYNLIDGTLNYQYLPIPNELKQTVDIDSVTPGFVDKIGIGSGGSFYKIGESVIFDGSSTQGSGASAKVSLLDGVTVSNVSFASSTITGVEIYPSITKGVYNIIAQNPHNFEDNDIISVSGLSTTSSQIGGYYNIGISTNNLILSGLGTDSTGVGTAGVTGIVTYFNVEGNLLSVHSNDIYKIGSERIKILNIDDPQSRVRVLREQDGTIGSAHTVTSIFYDQQRRLSINAGFNTTDSATRNKEIYFDPIESVSVGVGIGTTLTLLNPGIGVTQVFVPSKSIYLKNHLLNTGDKLTYYTNTGTALSVRYSESSSIVSLTNGQTLYAAKINSNLVGISTVLVGLGSTGGFVGVASEFRNSSTLFFTGIGTGTYHSFKTNYEPLTAEITRNLVKVATASSHGLINGNIANVKVSPTNTSNITVKYNDYNRRIVINPRDFTNSDVDVDTNSITITDHGYSMGQKVIHTASTSSGGLSDNGIYYVIVVDTNTIKLSNTYYNATNLKPSTIEITSASAGTISPINPPIKVYDESTVNFNLNDSSLGYTKLSTPYSAFELNFYTDENMTTLWDKSQDSQVFAVKRTGRVGITTDAKVSLSVTKNVPNVLYYKFIPIYESDLPVVKKEIYIDDTVISGSEVQVNVSGYNGNHQISVGATNVFSYTVGLAPESASYISSTSQLSYTTSSKTALGPISQIDVINGGNNYYELPGISTVSTVFGKNAIVEAKSETIGKINHTKINNIGYDFPSDNTLRPTLNIPQVIKVNTLQAIDFVGITSVGRGYTSAPDLLLFDGETGEQVEGLDLFYDLDSSTVTILSNIAGVNNAQPKVLPTKNSNGVGISTINFDTATKDVIVTLAVGFGTDETFPFSVNDKVMIEGVNIGIGSTGRGYNSESYDYKLFPLNNATKNAGGIATVRYSLAEYFTDNIITPGNIDTYYSAGRIIPEKYFPSFNVELVSKEYYIGETVESISASGIVEGWNSNNGILNVTSNDNFVVGEVIKGLTSGSQGIGSSVTSYDSHINLNYFSTVKEGWQSDSGVLNDSIQRLQDNLYYQRFAYSLKTRVPYTTWEDVVSTLNHTAGFQKYADYQVESSNLGSYGIVGTQVDPTSAGTWETVSSVGQDNESESAMVVETVGDTSTDMKVDVVGYSDLNCVYDFDIVTEMKIGTAVQPISIELGFSSRVLTNYYESIGNRVLSVDDISSQFNSAPRTSTYSVVSSFDLSASRSQKFITYVKDKRFYNTRQLMVVDLVHDNYLGYMNQYGRVDNVYDLGSFDFNILGTNGQLLFYPTSYQVNDFDITALSYNLDDNILSVGSSYFGSAAEVKTSSVSIPSNTPTTIVSLASTYRAAKVLVSITADSTKTESGGEFEFDELNIINDGTTVDLVEYPQLITSSGEDNPIPGFGTYSAYIDGSLMKIDWHPHNTTAGVGTTSIVNTIQVAISSETSTGIGTFDMKHARLEGRSTSISSSGSPSPNVIGSYPNTYDAAYFIVQISDTTNNYYQFSEVVAIDDYDSSDGSGDTYNAEYGILETVTGLGTIGTRITGAGVGNDATVELVFTPLPNIDAHVNVFMNALRIQDDSQDNISFNNGSIQSEYGSYTGTEQDIKRSFELKHESNPIFERSFNASSTDVINLTNDTIQLPNHYFVTGEELTYIHAGAGTTQAIGIASTDGFVGIGTTDKLPSTVFAIKISEDKIKVAETAQKALLGVANNVDLTSVGIGTSHRFVSSNQNARILLTLDNIIQSPIVSTAVTTHLTDEVFTTSDIIEFAGITSFFGGDLIKVNNEIMKIEGIGIGNTNSIRVRRSWLGTSLAGYSTGDVVTKVIGNYNIVENVLNFVEAPYGVTPISSTTNPPDDRDWVGIATGSHFQGRTFMRSGIQNTSSETYSKNYIFDDISANFTGTVRDFTLTSAGSTVTGLETDNAVILINDVFQGPGLSEDYTIEEAGATGVTTITFTGTASSIASDVNTSNLPIGGVIVSVGSTEGFGYQPLVAAGGTAVVAIGGTIESISIGNTGSGYRAGSQIVNVGIQTQDLTGTSITGIGTATIVDGHITGIAVTNTAVIYKPKDIQNVGYNSITGITTITTATPHGLSIGNDVVVSGIAFTCTYSPPVEISAAVYDNVSGIMTVTTSSNHGFSAGKDIILTGLAMTCGLDSGISTHYYPRNRDRVYDTAISITGTSSTSITVNVTSAGLSDQYTHQFVNATTGAVITGGNYGHKFVTSVPNAVTVTGWTTAFTPSNAVYNPVNGQLVITSTSHGLSTSNTVSVATDGITFTCDMDSHSTNHSYPRTTDPIAGIATAVTAVSADTFTINVGSSPIVNYNVTDANYNAGSGELELIIGSHSLTSGSSIKLLKESLIFKCSKDNYISEHKYPRGGDPAYDGVNISAVNSPTQFAVNVGVSTVPTFYKENGTVQGVIIAPRPSDPLAAQTDVIDVLDSTSFIINSGISTRKHLYARGGTVSIPMEVVIDDPLSYSNLPLQYSSSSVSGIGSNATVDVVVGQGSSVIDFRVGNTGYGYGNGEILTVPVGGLTGIPTTSGFKEFQLTIDEIFTDEFTGWSLGQLQTLDNVSYLFDGNRLDFPLSVSGSTVSIKTAKGSPINIEDVLLIFVNDILQVPGKGYTFKGGSTITFTEAPKTGDTCKLIFYKGSGDIDVKYKEIEESVEIGDSLTVNAEPPVEEYLQEDPRTVSEIISTDNLSTLPYYGPGITGDPNLERPVTLCRQTSDLIINEKEVSKARQLYEGRVFPTAFITKTVGINSTIIYVDNVRPFFDSKKESDVNLDFQDEITITSQDLRVGASATSYISTGGTVTSISIIDGGTGYTSTPTVSIANAVGLGSTATATATVSAAGTISSVVVSYAGTGYATKPEILIDPPTVITETDDVDSYVGDYGVVVGFGTTTIGTVDKIIMDLYIPTYSDLRKPSLVGTAITVSSLSKDDFFIVTNSNAGVGSTEITSKDNDGATIGIGTQFIDNIYQVSVASNIVREVVGIGTTTVRRLYAAISGLSTVTFGSTGIDFSSESYTFDDDGEGAGSGYPGIITTSNYYGNYSWGKITLTGRSENNQFGVYPQGGVTGISTWPLVQRTVPLKSKNYII